MKITTNMFKICWLVLLGMLYLQPALSQQDQQNIVEGQNTRTLENRMLRRAFEGAPPRIPHEVPRVLAKPLGSECKTCHEFGGYVKRFNNHAPKTPHPTWVNCRQCHVPTLVTDHFANSQNSFDGLDPKILSDKGETAAYRGAPPPIPHAVDQRKECLSCHDGKGAIVRIKSTHPERSNCLQCHVAVANAKEKEWKRGSK